jgi:hypothetical protein
MTGKGSDALLAFKSHIDGRNADVQIFADRIEWSQQRGAMRRASSSEMMPVRSISSVTSSKDGLVNHKLTVIATGNTIEFRVPRPQAEQVKTLLTELIRGAHPSQQPATTTPAESPATTSTSVADELGKLVALRDAGVLTPDEFDAQKARILGT